MVVSLLLGSLPFSEASRAETEYSLRSREDFLMAQSDADSEADRLFQEGLQLFEQGSAASLQQALPVLEQARQLYQAAGNSQGEAVALLGLGRVSDVLGELQQGLEFYTQALSLFQAVGDRAGEATSLNNIGGVYDALGDRQQALEYYQQALPIWREVGDRDGEAQTLGNIAFTHRAEGKLTQALDHINTALALIEDLRAQIGSDDLRASYFATVQGYYQFKIDLLMQLHQQRPQERYDIQAFATSEQARARVLLDLLNSAHTDIRQGVNPQLLAQEQQLQQQLQQLEAQRIQLLSGEHTPQQAAQLDRQSNTLLQQLQQLTVQIRRNSPAYAALQYPQPLNLEQIQQQVLDPDTVLLQYALGDQQSYLWVVTSTSLTSYVLPNRNTIEQAVQQFRSVLETSGNAIADVKRKGDPLTQMLLPNIGEQIANKRLLIVGDGAIQSLPFAALPFPNAATYTPLLQNHEILTQPSASAVAVLRQQFANQTPADKAIAILADPVYRADDERVTGVATATSLSVELERSLRDLDLRAIQRLPNTRAEAEQILALVSSADESVAFDFNANYDWSINPQLADYRMVHFATHGFVNPVNPELSGIVLSLVNPQGQYQEQGFLRLHDIFNLKLNAELVVLSACQTGLGENVQGEGLVGLTRGFMYAGAERVMVSLWNVNDEATAQLMGEFYRQMLQSNLTPAAALRQAQLKMWERNPDPRLWAAFIMQGEWQQDQ
jgi:CHAT domain-containing protein